MVCSICLEEMFEDGTFLTLHESLKTIYVLNSCGHQFHQFCLERALANDPRCPKCRSDVGGHDVRSLLGLIGRDARDEDNIARDEDHGIEFLGVVPARGFQPRTPDRELRRSREQRTIQGPQDRGNVLVHELQHGEGHELELAGHGLELGGHVLGLGEHGAGRDQDDHVHALPVLDERQYEIRRICTKLKIICKCGASVERFWVKWANPYQPTWEDVRYIEGHESCAEALESWRVRHLGGSTPERLVDHLDNDRAHEQPIWTLSGNKRKVLAESRAARSSAVRQIFRRFDPQVSFNDVQNALRNLLDVAAAQQVNEGPIVLEDPQVNEGPEVQEEILVHEGPQVHEGSEVHEGLVVHEDPQVHEGPEVHEGLVVHEDQVHEGFGAGEDLNVQHDDLQETREHDEPQYGQEAHERVGPTVLARRVRFLNYNIKHMI
uniref:RING-type domain-containing protein n=1 Tax=Meloidogyne javanica TaxID=6303 RepID=A0A915LSB3_MELJA